MRLKTQLAKLEASTAESEPSRKECALLVSILARRDALFWPWRFQMNRNIPIPELRRRQREYLSRQIGIAAKADGRDNWKDAHSMRQRLIAAGYITATHSSGQVQSVFLTPTGEAYARALVGDRLNTFAGSQILFLWLCELSTQTPVHAVRESVLFCRDDLNGCPNDWDDLTEIVLPLLTCGIVEADSDTQGRAAYVPTDAPEPPEMTVVVAFDDEMDGFYVKAFNDERNVLENVEPRDTHEIIIPLPATGWGWPCYFNKDDEKP